MKRDSVPYRRMVFVCTHARPEGDRVSCGPRGGEALCEAFKAEVKKRGLTGKIRALKSGCMDLCEKGPNVMVFPEARLISDVSTNDTATLLDEFLV